ncbi:MULTISPECIES: acyloxyacyl hydrolase [Aquimarina]|uniref:Acyloxyacyl hydrolase n=1 Tax=Aquimarina algiphila TaxID=2047982 RepID=A0A554VNI5_9FLAO|nr:MULTISPECIES: acyloxyacyl hydrolase [Aquimarina]TSE09939.1 acyloxyacyl hydrolase [Aquimarina algiphila]
MIKQICLVISILHFGVYAQVESKAKYTLDVNNFYGSILKHNPDISHLITGHPSGLILSFQRKTFGDKEWQRLYNNPDYGVSFLYQNLDNEYLGEHYGVYLHYNFYFFNRLLMFRIGQGASYNTTPYDEDDNFRNVAYGTHLVSGSYALLNLKKVNIFKGLGLQAGLGIVHYSNGNSKAPNKSTNTLFLNAGVTYTFDQDTPAYAEKEKGLLKGAEPIGYGFVFRSGVNESDVVGSGRFPFYTFAAFADKRLNKKSAIQLGAEVFFSKALERFIDFRASGGFNDGTTGDEDAKRAGVFLGHELRVSRTSLITQFGYYFYYPYDFEGQTYLRAGLQYYFTKNIFGSLTVRSHAAKAETMEFSIGYRL